MRAHPLDLRPRLTGPTTRSHAADFSRPGADLAGQAPTATPSIRLINGSVNRRRVYEHIDRDATGSRRVPIDLFGHENHWQRNRDEMVEMQSEWWTNRLRTSW